MIKLKLILIAFYLSYINSVDDKLIIRT